MISFHFKKKKKALHIHRERELSLYIVKVMVSPVVMCRYESWTIKKAKHQRTDAFKTVVLEKTLESPLDCKEIKSVSPKGNQP